MLLAIVPMIVCGQCHAEVVARYSRSPMANTSGPIATANEVSGSFVHGASGVRFEIVKSGRRLNLQWNGHRQPLDFFIGSGRMGRSYAIAEEGHLYQAPVGYYGHRGLWDMAPGYENDRQPDFNRPITEDCLFCHATGAKALPQTLNRYADFSALQGISCQRCHGDASTHLAHPQAGNIVNPGKLPLAERDSICEQCHLTGEARIPQPARHIADYQPGQRLSTYLAVFVSQDRGAGIRVTSHSEALAASRCRSVSGQKLWCGTCHNPHGQTADYRETCRGCHVAQACPVASRAPNSGQADCIRCHMPKARAYDGGHTVFTDHSIPRRPADYASRRVAPEGLAPYFPAETAISASRNLGIAWAQVAENYADPRAFDKAWPMLRVAASEHPRDALLYAKIGEALESASKTTEAEKSYRLSLEQDPEQVDVITRLAALLERSGRRTEASALRKRALTIYPRQPK